MTYCVREGPRAPHTHDDDVGYQFIRNCQDALSHRPDLYHHFRLVQQLGFRGDHFA